MWGNSECDMQYQTVMPVTPELAVSPPGQKAQSSHHHGDSQGLIPARLSIETRANSEPADSNTNLSHRDAEKKPVCFSHTHCGTSIKTNHLKTPTRLQWARLPLWEQVCWSTSHSHILRTVSQEESMSAIVETGRLSVSLHMTSGCLLLLWLFGLFSCSECCSVCQHDARQNTQIHPRV